MGYRAVGVAWCALMLQACGDERVPGGNGTTGPTEVLDAGDAACVDHAACVAAGEFCAATGACEAPDTSCEASRESGVEAESGGVVLFAVTPFDPRGTELEPGGGAVPRDTCTDEDATLRGFQVSYYAAGASFPTDDLALYERVRFFNSGNPRGAGAWYTAASDHATEGSFALFLCVLNGSGEEPWAVAFEGSSALCFDAE